MDPWYPWAMCFSAHRHPCSHVFAPRAWVVWEALRVCLRLKRGASSIRSSSWKRLRSPWAMSPLMSVGPMSRGMNPSVVRMKYGAAPRYLPQKRC